MKKIIFLSFIFILNIYAANYNEYYNEYINKYISKEKNIISSVYNYIYNTGDINVTRYKISEYYNFSPEYFTNLNNEKCNLQPNSNYCDNTSGGINPVIDITNYTLTLKNHYDLNKLNNKLIINYQNSPFLPSDFILTGNDLKIILKPDIVKYITTINNLKSSGIYISSIQPEDTKINEWVKPNLNGILSLYLKNNDGKWLHVYDLNKNILNFDIYINKKDNININLIKLPKNSKISIYDDTTKKFEKYISTGDEWKPLITNTNFDIWAGDSDIYDLSCVIFDKPSKSEANIGTTDKYITTPQKFIKYDDFGSGYWNSNKYYIIKDYSTLTDLSFKSSNNDIAYKCSDDTLKYDVLTNINGKWYYLIDNYPDIFYYNSKPDEEKYVLTWNLIDPRDNTLKKIFKGETINDKVIWNEIYDYNNGDLINEELYKIAENRTDFINLEYNKFYLTKNSDCVTTGNCNGSDKYNYGGWKIDNMYVWIFDGTSLIDAYPVDTYKEMYEGDNSLKNAYFLKSNQKVYIKDYDNNNNVIYREKDDNSFWTENGQKIPQIYIYNGHPSFPSKVLTDDKTTNDEDINAMNVVFLNNIMVLNDKIRMINWKKNINIETPVIISGNKGNYVFKGKYWINNDTKEILTGYTRKELPVATNSDYIYLTLYIGCDENNLYDVSKECRYTNDGIKNSNEHELYQWYYAPTIKSVNNLIDVVQLNTISDLYNIQPDIGYVAQTNTIYMKKMDVNNNICYYKLNSSDVILKNGEYLPYLYIENDDNNNLIKINIPNNRTCSNLNIDNNSILFSDRTDMLNWTNLKEGYNGKLLINSNIYTVKKNTYNNKYYFERNDGQEFVAIDKSTFDNIAYYNYDNKKYITLNLGDRTLYNNGLKIGDYLTTPLKINGIFSENDKNLFVWYPNPLYLQYNMDQLTDIFITDNIQDIYNSNMNKVIYNSSLYGFMLLNKDQVNDKLCYINKPDINDIENYDYILKLTGKKSLTKNNLPFNMNCTNSKFYDNSLIVPDMITAINWTRALNGYSVILSSLNNNDKYTLVKYNDKAYWINNPDLEVQYITDDNEPNKIYAYNRSKIDTIPLDNLGLRAYTINIDGENTNTKLTSDQTYYLWINYKNLDNSIQNAVYEINNLTDYIKSEKQTNNDLFVNIKNINKEVEYTNIIDNVPEFNSNYKLHFNKTIDDLNCSDILEISAFNSYYNFNTNNNYLWSNYLNDYVNDDIIVINNKEYQVTMNNYSTNDYNSYVTVNLKDLETGEYYELPETECDLHNITFKAYDENNQLVENLSKIDNSTLYFDSSNIVKTTLYITPTIKTGKCDTTLTVDIFNNNTINDVINNCPDSYLYYDNTKCYRNSYIITHYDNSIDKVYNMDNIVYNIDTNTNEIKSYDIINNETLNNIFDISQYPVGTLFYNELTNKSFLVIFNTLTNKNELKIIY